MARVIWSPQAFKDLEVIGDFIAREAPLYAQMTIDGIFTAVNRLEVFPQSGRVVPEIEDSAIREIVYRGYRIMYILTLDGEREEVEILTVFHSSIPFGAPPKEE